MAKQKLVSLKDLQNRLRLPGASQPVTERVVYRILTDLGIQTEKQNVPGDNYPRAFVSAEQASEVEADFRRTHRKKFKAAEKK